jgi:N-acetyl-anhydromuramyl-L-alanine amidase AmpD
VRGPIQGRLRTQWDFTAEQYEALARLAAGLARLFPRIEIEAPRGPDGRVLDRAFAGPEESARFCGIVGHYHLTTEKSDPGPAFDWERVIEAARRHAER